MLRLKPLDAKFNKDSDTFSKMDPFVILDLDGRKHQTQIHHNGGKNPVWDQQFQYNTKDLGQMNLRIETWDNDTLKNDLIGANDFNIKMWLQKPNIINNEVIDLLVNGEVVGSIRIQYFYNPSVIPTTNSGFLL